MSQLQIFNYSDKPVRTIVKEDGPWWVLKDVADILDIRNHKDIASRLNEDEKGVDSIDTPGGIQSMITVNEPGLYNVIIRSDKPEAKSFKRWITHEVVPQIRKTGVYLAPTVDSKMLYQIAQALEEKEKQISVLKPKAEFFDTVANSKTAIEMSKAAKVLEFGKGRNVLFRILREEKILRYNNEPYQEYIDRGYFRTIEQKYQKKDGTTCINIKTLVYQKGLDYIGKLLEKRKAVS